jgi:hypothetical protein
MIEKKEHAPEYTLHVVRRRDPDTNKTGIALVVQTVREFVSFEYQIPVESTKTGTMISMKIHGLHVPENLVPGKGRAKGFVIHERLNGAYDLVVTNVDGMENRFVVNIHPPEILVRGLTRRPFIVPSSEPVQV